MVEMYYYFPADKAEVAVECGMKLSEWFSREINIDGEFKKCISALLNPRDDIAAYKSRSLRCARLEITPKYCRIAEGYYYRLGRSRPEAMKLYEASVIHVEEYRFGQYRMPECLILCTVMGESISLLDRGLDSPILFGSSEELYFNNLIEGFRDAHGDFNDAAMYYLFNALAEAGAAVKIEDTVSGMAVFREEISGRKYAINIPRLDEYF